MSNSTKLLTKKLEKLELIQLLEEKERRIKSDPLKYMNPYTPKEHKKQIEFHESLRIIRALFWGNRVGKTEAGGMETAYFVTGKHPHRPEVVPPIDAWVGCPSFELQPEGTQAKLEKYLPKNEIKKIDYLRGNIWKNVYLKNGSKITFKSYEQGREKWQSAGKDLIWFDEEPPSDIWEEAVVRQEAGRILNMILTMTPINGMTWVYDDIYMDTGNPDLFVSSAGWNDNPYLTPRQIELMSRNIKSEEMLRVRRKGEFIARVGLVCSWWRREKHLREYKEFPKDWSYYEIIDGGWSDPTAWLLIGVDNDNNIHVIDGFREPELLESEIYEKRTAKTGGFLIRNGWIDNDNPRMQKTLNKLGMSLLKVEKIPGESKSWDETLAEKLAEYGRVQKATDQPRLFINSALSWLVQEIENLKWLEHKRRDGTEVKPIWDDHRKFKHHWDGIRGLAYFLIMYMKPVKKNNKKPGWAQKGQPSWSRS